MLRSTTFDNISHLAKKVILGITPPIIIALIRKTIRGRDVSSDEYILWISAILGGFLSQGNVRAFDYAVRHMPPEGAIVEIGSLFGLSTNIITYLTIKYERDNPFFTCDPWVFESLGRPVGGYFDADSEAYRDYAKKVFKMNTALFSAGRQPYTIEAYSHQFFKLWHTCSTTEDVFGRPVTLGGPISFAYIDGAHAYNAVKGDFLGVDQHLLPGGFILFDDSADLSGFEVNRVVAEVKRDPSYELVFKTPNYFFRRRGYMP
jgi:hypothetical protein